MAIHSKIGSKYSKVELVCIMLVHNENNKIIWKLKRASLQKIKNIPLPSK